MSDSELLDLLDADGRPLIGPDGHPATKSRAEVHDDGDWHAAFHLWVVCADGVVLQRRAAGKQAWPGLLDASAAGHLTAGEQPIDGLREAEEELGVSYRPDELHPLGCFQVDERQSDGTINREHQHVYCVVDDRPLRAFCGFDRTEVAGLVAVPAPRFRSLAGGCRVDGLAWDGVEERDVAVVPSELVPAPYLPEIAAKLS